VTIYNLLKFFRLPLYLFHREKWNELYGWATYEPITLEPGTYEITAHRLTKKEEK